MKPPLIFLHIPNFAFTELRKNVHGKRASSDSFIIFQFYRRSSEFCDKENFLLVNRSKCIPSARSNVSLMCRAFPPNIHNEMRAKYSEIFDLNYRLEFTRSAHLSRTQVLRRLTFVLSKTTAEFSDYSGSTYEYHGKMRGYLYLTLPKSLVHPRVTQMIHANDLRIRMEL